MALPITATWIGGDGDWIAAANWQEPNASPPYGSLHYAPNASTSVSIGAVTVAYGTIDEIWSLQTVGTVLEINSGLLVLDHDSRISGGSVYLSSPATLSIKAGATLVLAASIASLGGAMRGAGTLEIDGATEFGAASVTVAALYLHNQTLTLTTALSYAGVLTEQSSAGLNLNGQVLTVSGSANTLGGTVSGLTGGVLKVTGAAHLASTTVGDYFRILAGAIVEDAKSITQDGDVGDHGLLQVDAGAIYTVATTARINNGDFTNSGTLTIAAGATLRLATQNAALGGAIAGAGTLEIDGATDLTSARLTVAALDLNNQTLTLATSLSYAGALTEDSSSGLNLDVFTLTLSGMANALGGPVTGSGGRLKITGSADLATQALGGYFQLSLGVTLEDARTITQYGDIGLAGVLQIDSGAVYTIAGAVWINGGTLTNAGTLAINTGAILRLAALSATLGGAITGAGTLEIDAATILTSAALTVAALALNNQTLTLATSLAYAGALTEHSSSGLDLGTYTLTLSGSANALGGPVLGSGGRLKVTGSADLATAALGGYFQLAAGTTLEDAKTVTQDGGIGNGGVIQVDAGAIYAVAAAAWLTGGTFTNAGSLTVDAGATLRLATQQATLGGAISGAGTLEIDGATRLTSAKLTVAALDLNNQTLTLATSLAYAGALTEQSSSGLNLSIYTLTLSGSANALGGPVSGSGGVLRITGSADLGPPELGGYCSISAGAILEDAGAITEDGDIGGSGQLKIDAGATYAITASSQIEVANFRNGGTLTVSSGLLDVETAVSGTGTDVIAAASQLEFDAPVASQTIDFSGSGAALLLGDPYNFQGEISGFDATGTGDMISLTGAWTVSLFSENAALTGGTLDLVSGVNQLTLNVSGDYAGGHFTAKAGAGITLLTYA